MRRPVALFAAFIVVAACTIAFAEAPPAPQGPPSTGQAPARDKLLAKTGTGTIKGRIVAADNGAPIRRARVSLDSGNPLESRGTATDLDGRYEFTELAAGNYRVSASKGIYVTLEYGQRRPFERGKPVELKEGAVAEKIDIALPRGGVVAGVLLDDVGDPAAGVRVMAMRQQFGDGKRGMVNIGRAAETNDIGQYRLYGLPPGSYFINALPSTSNPLIPMFTTPGGAPTYYPGTLSEMEAQRVQVRVGQERLLPDFTLVPSRLVKITGTATSSGGGPVQVVMLMSTAQAAGGSTLPGMTMATVRPDGTFRLNNVAPGEYALMATAVNVSTAEQEITAMPLTVAGEDITDVVIATTKGFKATGQVLFDQGTPPPGLLPSALMLVGTPASQFSMTGGLARATIKDDWTFEMTGLAGPRLFRFGQGMPTGWMTQSVFRGQTDITDTPLDITGDVDGIIITLTNRSPSIGGTVSDGAGKPVSDCTIVIFPDEAAQGPPHSGRYLRAVRPGDDGKYKAQNLPAATYMVVALEWLEPGDENDPELLEQLRPLATRTALSWGDAKELSLTVTKYERR
jgi:hypothetical protein